MKPGLNSEIVNDFIIRQTLVRPIEDILNKLDNGDFRDCDIKWLDAKLEKFMAFAAETLRLPKVPNVPKEDFQIMNSYVYNYYSKYFTGLLNYFKTFLDLPNQ